MMIGSVFTWIVIDSSIFKDVVESGVAATSRVAMVIIPLFLMMELGISCVKYLMGDGNGFLDLKKFFSYLLIWFFTFQFMNVMNMADAFVNVIEVTIRTTVFDSSGGANLPLAIDKTQGIAPEVLDLARKLSRNEITTTQLSQMIQNGTYTENQVNVAIKLSGLTNPSGNADEGVFNFLSRLFSGTYGIFVLILQGINGAVISFLRVFIEMLGSLLCAVLIIVGPLAVAFNMLPFGINEGTLKNWFGTWLSIRCWAITITVYDYLFDSIMKHSAEAAFNPASSDLMKNLDQLSFYNILSTATVIMYIMTPFVTNLYAKGSGSQFASLAVGAAVMMTKGAAAVTSNVKSMPKMDSRGPGSKGVLNQ